MVELTPDDQTLLELVRKRVGHFEQTLGTHYRDGLWTRMDKLYHSYTGLKRALNGTTGQQRDDIYRDARKEFGHELFIPYAYSIVETQVPAVLSNPPRLNIKPGDLASDKNVQHVKAMLDAQQENVTIELPMQSVIKSGFQYGIGVGKSYWLRREGQRTRVVPSAWYQRALGNPWSVETSVEPLFDDPTFEHVPARDFGWDPFGASIDKCRYAWHRTWRDEAYVKARLMDPAGWTRYPLGPDEICDNNGSIERYRKSVRGSFDAQYIPIPSDTMAGMRDIHEVLEYHDGAQIVTVLDRKWIVNVIPNETFYGKLPFAVYRPTEVLNQMVGKGEIEPIEDLQEEMNQIRTDRRWNAAMAMGPVIFYNDGLIDPDQIKVGPGELNPVNGDPNDILKVLEIPDVPNSSWRETGEITQDIIRTSGYSDAFAGGDSANTATEAQLSYQGMSSRLRLKAHRAEIEVMKPVAEHWLALDQRHILEQRDVRVPAPPVPGEPERRWSWFQLGPDELAGEFDVSIDGGSTAPENVPQQRQDAQIIATVMASPFGQLFDPRQMAVEFLDRMQIKNPEAKLNQGALVPPETLQVIGQHLTEMGMDPGMAQQLIQGSQAEVMQAQDQMAQQPDHGQGTPAQQQPGPQPPQQ